MKRNEFEKLKVGDLCKLKGKHDKGRVVVVKYIEDDYVVIKPADGGVLHDVQGYTGPKLKLTVFSQLDTMTKTEEF